MYHYKYWEQSRKSRTEPKDRRTTTSIENRAERVERSQKTGAPPQVLRTEPKKSNGAEKQAYYHRLKLPISQAFKTWELSVLSVHCQISWKLTFTSKPRHHYTTTSIKIGAKKQTHHHKYWEWSQKTGAPPQILRTSQKTGAPNEAQLSYCQYWASCTIMEITWKLTFKGKPPHHHKYWAQSGKTEWSSAWLSSVSSVTYYQTEMIMRMTWKLTFTGKPPHHHKYWVQSGKTERSLAWLSSVSSVTYQAEMIMEMTWKLTSTGKPPHHHKYWAQNGKTERCSASWLLSVLSAHCELLART